ncbi:MAG: 1,4-alpha-glucan branching enzyme, partial [Acidobacteriota bacterium]
MTKSSRTTRSSGGAGRKPAGSARKGHRGPSRLITSDDLYLFNEGSHFRLYDKLGAHPLEAGGVHFAVWAPNAARVSVIGDFNGWRPERDALEPTQSSGIWRGIAPDAAEGACYKFHVESNHSGYVVDKADPFAFCTEEPPKTASVVWQSHHEWADTEWMTGRR